MNCHTYHRLPFYDFIPPFRKTLGKCSFVFKDTNSKYYFTSQLLIGAMLQRHANGIIY
jgi:hypothetical protein